MNVTVEFDSDVHRVITAYASAKDLGLSAAINELIRKVEHDSEATYGSSRLVRNEHGYLVIAGTGNVLTPEMVKETSEDALIEYNRPING